MRFVLLRCLGCALLTLAQGLLSFRQSTRLGLSLRLGICNSLLQLGEFTIRLFLPLYGDLCPLRRSLEFRLQLGDLLARSLQGDRRIRSGGDQANRSRLRLLQCGFQLAVALFSFGRSVARLG